LTLLTGFAALVSSSYRLQRLDLGFRSDDVVTFELGLPAPRYDAVRRAIFQEELARRLEEIPGVSAAGGTSRLPATGTFHPWTARPLTGPLAGADGTNTQQRVVSGHFFSALGIPLLAGRVFDERDDATAPARAVVSESLARQFFPGMTLDEVVGQRIRVLGTELRDIIGVVGDVALDARGTRALGVYHAHAQFADDRNWALTGVVAVRLPADQAMTRIRTVVAALDPELVVYQQARLADVVGKGTARESFALVLMAAFAAVALLLSAIGLYGVLAYTVRERTHEIGIRMALGATAIDIHELVLRQGARLVVLGVAVGLGGALASGRLLSALLFETSPSDPRLLAATVCLLCVVAACALWLPARRAAGVAPTNAMREE
jgi:putative ABC transport system permease protein